MICMISCIGKVNYTRNFGILTTIAACGFDVASIAPGSLDGTERSSGITHYALSLPSANFWYDAGFGNTLRAIVQRARNVVALIRKVEQVRPEMLLCSEPDAWFVAILMKLRYGCKVIVDLQEVYEDRALAFPKPLQGVVRRLLRNAMRVLSSRTDEVIHVSQERQDIYNYLHKRGLVIGSYPELKLFPSPTEKSADVHTGLVQVIHAGALRPTYASQQLLDAMRIVADAAPQVRFVVLGGVAGKLENEKLIGSLTEKGVLEFIEQVPFSDVIRWLYSSDIGINLVLPIDTAHRLAAPQKLYEYFAASLPVVVADVPTLRRTVTQHRCGVVVDPLSPQSIADGIIALAQNQEIRREQGQNGRLAAESEYNWESQARKLCGLIATLYDRSS